MDQFVSPFHILDSVEYLLKNKKKESQMECSKCKEKKKISRLILVDYSAVFIRYKCIHCGTVYQFRTKN